MSGPYQDAPQPFRGEPRNDAPSRAGESEQALERLRAIADQRQAIPEEARTTENVVGVSVGWTPTHALWAGGMTLAFGVIVCSITALLLRKEQNLDSEKVLRLIGVPVIVICAVYILILGYNKEQITPVIGLFGTLAGYLLGRSAKG